MKLAGVWRRPRPRFISACQVPPVRAVAVAVAVVIDEGGLAGGEGERLEPQRGHAGVCEVDDRVEPARPKPMAPPPRTKAPARR